MAQVLYKHPNSTTSLSIHDNTFECKNVDADIEDVIFKYDIAAVVGRPSVFRLGESINNVVMEQITTEKARKSEIYTGLLDPSLFTMQFADNTFSTCHHMHKGAIYYLEEGARIRDLRSDYGYASALHGGVAFVTGDGTYFHYASGDSEPYIEQVKAYYGGFAYVEHGATVEVKTEVRQQFCEAYEGVAFYAINRARVVTRDGVKFQSNKARKRALFVILEGS